MTDPAVGLAAIVVLGVGAQWIAQRVRVPMVLPLLVAGLIAGPVTGIVDPTELFGELLFPAVSLGVGILLFEGGLGLRLAELGAGRGPVVRLVTIGVLVTWVIGAVAAWALFDLDRPEALLLGAVLVVSGPTVVLPLLKQLRLRRRVDSVARWEGIVIDPVGAVLAVTVLEVVVKANEGPGSAVAAFAVPAGIGVALGLAGAGALVFVFQRHLVPDRLHNGVTLMLVVVVFTAANVAAHEAGLFAATVMGVVLANQRRVPLDTIEEFEETLGLLILAALFVVLGATLEPRALLDQLVPGLVLAGVLLVVARPLAVLASTVGTGLSRRERLFLMCLAPRGIVAAAVSVVFTLELADEGQALPELVPATYIVVFATVIAASVLAGPAARRLRLARAEPRGLLIVGGQPWARALGRSVLDADVPVLLVSSDPDELDQAAAEGLLTYRGPLDGAELDETIEVVGIRQALVTSKSTELNAFLTRHLGEELGRANVFFVPGSSDDGTEGTGRAARRAFDRDSGQVQLARRFSAGERFRMVDAAPAAGTAIDDGDTSAARAGALVAVTADGRVEVVDAARPGLATDARRVLVLGPPADAPG